MCGICGIINFDGSHVKPNQLLEMMGTMTHRGPDDQGHYIDKHIGLGFVRLSILDLSIAGHQPMNSNNQRFWITFNGEIYNYIEIRKELIEKGYKFISEGDTEVLLSSYIEWGEDCLDRLNGMFAFVIYDSLNKSLFGARDRFGIKPFYYTITNNTFIYASDIPPILATLSEKPNPNDAIIFDYLVFNRVNHTNQTFFDGIVKLPAGYKITYLNGTVTTNQWYNLREKVSAKKLNNFKFRESFLRSVNLQLRSDVPVGSCLSGGLDSSAITAAVLLNHPETDLHTFSAIYEKGQKGDESEFIKLFSDRRLKMHFTSPTVEGLLGDLDEFIVAQSEPVSNTSEYAEFMVMKLAKKNCTVILNGQGADEIMAGYHYFFGYYFKDLFKRFKLLSLFREIRVYIKKHKSYLGLKYMIFSIYPEIFNNFNYNQLTKEFVSAHKIKKNDLFTKFYKSKNLQSFLIKHFEYKFEHHLLWADKNGMYFSLETRFPFLDHELVEDTLANGVTIENGYTKFLMREELIGILPEKIRLRVDKVGFATPEDDWFKTNEMKLLMHNVLNSESFKSRGYFDAQKCLLYYTEFLKGSGDSKQLWKWLNLELWFNKYID